VLADSFGFFLTYRYGQVIIDKLITKWDGKIFSVEKYLRKYAFGTVFLTRIAGPFAPYVNFLSGLIGVPYSKFVIADFLGNAIGAIFFFVAGYILGNYWQVFLNDTWIVTIVITILFIGYVVYKTVIKKKKSAEV
jgi:membrane protein DedA with SNARE-associated domain